MACSAGPVSTSWFCFLCRAMPSPVASRSESAGSAFPSLSCRCRPQLPPAGWTGTKGMSTLPKVAPSNRTPRDFSTESSDLQLVSSDLRSVDEPSPTASKYVCTSAPRNP